MAVLATHESHKPLLEAKVNIEFLMAYAPMDNNGNPKGFAIMKGGFRIMAYARILSLKDRVAGRADAEIVIDGDWWDENSKETAKQTALLDHELHHLALKLADGQFCYDSHGRPKLRMRKHDIEVGWFKVIAERNGSASIERSQAKSIMEASGQYFWPELAGPGMPAHKPARALTAPIEVKAEPLKEEPKFKNEPKFEKAKPKKKGKK